MTGRDRDVERQQVSYRNKRDVSAAPRPPHARLIREAYADHRLRLVKRRFVDPGRERIEDHPGPRLTKGDFELLKETLIQEPRHSTNDCGRLCCAPSASAGGESQPGTGFCAVASLTATGISRTSPRR